jgi:hypothetical protein
MQSAQPCCQMALHFYSRRIPLKYFRRYSVKMGASFSMLSGSDGDRSDFQELSRGRFINEILRVGCLRSM